MQDKTTIVNATRLICSKKMKIYSTNKLNVSSKVIIQMIIRQNSYGNKFPE